MSQPALDLPVPEVPGRRFQRLPPRPAMLRAMQARDATFDGVFFVAVRTTGIFCRPSCPARKPKPENVVFFGSAKEALSSGFRPCHRCHPLEPVGRTPDAIRRLLDELEADPGRRIRDRDLRARGLEPDRVRRWFKKHHGMTFHAYQRGRRLAKAIHALAAGAPVTDAAFDHGFDSLSGFQEALRNATGRTASASRDAVVVHVSRVTTPLGPMLLGTTDEAVCLLEFTDRPMLETQLGRLSRRLDAVFVPGANEVGRALEAELDAYFRGDRTHFETPLLTLGTAFQERVWEELRSIPYGATRSYGEQARRIGAPKAVRAVARANGDNRLAILIPCHRVIGADGKLVGYGGGLWRKRYLLELEQRGGG
ncbi:MAG: methylated-DNA--[protein]-cysteine S-methyltransferase [Deinococcales bacterium]